MSTLTEETVNPETEYNVDGRVNNNVPNVVFYHALSIPVIHQLMPACRHQPAASSTWKSPHESID
jgi:hypothetical protein